MSPLVLNQTQSFVILININNDTSNIDWLKKAINTSFNLLWQKLEFGLILLCLRHLFFVRIKRPKVFGLIQRFFYFV